MVPFGSSPKISTPVENIVEKRRFEADLRLKSRIFGALAVAKPCRARFSADPATP